MILTAIIALALASFIWMVAPGPGVFATPARSMAFGFRSNLPTFTDLSALTFTSGGAIVATPLTVLPGVLVKYPLAATQLRRFLHRTYGPFHEPVRRVDHDRRWVRGRGP